MEFTKEQLDSSLAGLKDLQKSLESSQHGKILQKSKTPADQETEVPSNAGGEVDLSKSGAANKLSGAEFGPQHSGKEGGQASERKDESYEKAGDHKYDDDEKMSKMKKDDDDDDDDDKKDMKKMDKMKYSHADEGDESSLVKSFTEDGELKKAIDVSKFLGSLVNKTAECLDQMDSRLHKSFSHLLEQSNVQNQVIQQLAVENAELKKSFDQVLNQPSHAPRSIGAGINAVGRGPDDLNKSMSPNLDPRILKKSILNGMMKDVELGTLSATDLIKYETTDDISEEHFRHYGQRA